MLKDSIYLRSVFDSTHYKRRQDKKLKLAPLMKYDILIYPPKNGYNQYESHQVNWRKKEKIYGVFYIDKLPAADKEITILSPDGWMVVRKTDANGEFNFTPYTDGIYQSIYQHKEIKNGKFKGKSYDTL